MEEYAAALAAERSAWEAVRTRLPGSMDFDLDLWQRWRGAVGVADAAADRAKASVTLRSTRQLGRRFLGKVWPAPVQLPPVLSRARLPDDPPG